MGGPRLRHTVNVADRRLSRQALEVMLAQATSLCVLVGLIGLGWTGGMGMAALWLELVVVTVCLVIRAGSVGREAGSAESGSVDADDQSLWQVAEPRLRQYKRRLRGGYLGVVLVLGLVVVVALARHSPKAVPSAATMLITAFLIIAMACCAAIRVLRCSIDGSVMSATPGQIMITRPVEKKELLRAVIVAIGALLVVMISPGTVGWDENLQFGGRRGWQLEIVTQVPVIVAHYVMGFFVPFISSVATRATVALVLTKMILDLVIIRRSGPDRAVRLPKPFA